MSCLLISASFVECIPMLESFVTALCSSSVSTCSLSFFFSSIFVLYVAWRLWVFTVVPLLYVNRPKELPDWVPFHGHTSAFLNDPDALLTYGRRYFRDSREPFALKVAGKRLYILTSPQDVKELKENTSTVSQYRLTQELIIGMCSSATVRKGFIKRLSCPCNELGTVLILGDVEKPLIQHVDGADKSPLKCKLCLQALPNEFIQHVENSMKWDALSANYTKLISAEEKEVSLLGWCREIMINAATRTYFGEALLQIEPNLSQVLSDFEDESAKLLTIESHDSVNATFVARTKGIKAFATYLKLPVQQRVGEATFFRDFEDEYRRLGYDEEDMAALLWVVYWVINANTYKLTFWLLSHLLHSPSLFTAISTELSISTLAQPSPLFTACLNETLRLTSAPCTLHRVLSPTTIRSKIFLPDSSILIPYKHLHLSEEIFGPNVHDFEPERFLRHPELGRSEYFGGTLGGGMVLIKEAVAAFVALAMARFDVGLAPEPERGETKVLPVRGRYNYTQAKGEFPLDDDVEMGIQKEESRRGFPRLGNTRGSLGVVGPVQGDDLVLRIKLR